MAEVVNSQLIVRNTFLHFIVEDADVRRTRRSYSDHFTDYMNLHHKSDQCCCNWGDSTTAAGTSCADSVPCFSRADSEVGFDDVVCWADAEVTGPPGTLISQDDTTVIVRRIPGEVTRSDFLNMLDVEGFVGKYSFVYLPMNFEKRVALGYAIVNFSENTSAAAAVLHLPSVELAGKRLDASISEAKQSLSDLILRYRDSSVMHSSVPDNCKPVIFSDGLMVPFPKPTTTLDPPVPQKDKKKSKRSARSM